MVPKPASASSTVQTIWLLTQAQMDMGTVAQQQQNRKVDTHPDSVLRTDGCYCTRPRVEQKESIRPAQLREIFQYSPANLAAQPLQRVPFQKASHSARQAALCLETGARPNFAPMYGCVSSSQTGPSRLPFGKIVWGALRSTIHSTSDWAAHTGYRSPEDKPACQAMNGTVRTWGKNIKKNNASGHGRNSLILWSTCRWRFFLLRVCVLLNVSPDSTFL